jgi:hypothetical protein
MPQPLPVILSHLDIYPIFSYNGMSLTPCVVDLFSYQVMFSEVIAPQDVAVYGALCALASFDRSDLKVCHYST